MHMEGRHGENTKSADSDGLAKYDLLPASFERQGMDVVDTDNEPAHHEDRTVSYIAKSRENTLVQEYWQCAVCEASFPISRMRKFENSEIAKARDSGEFSEAQLSSPLNAKLSIN